MLIKRETGYMTEPEKIDSLFAALSESLSDFCERVEIYYSEQNLKKDMRHIDYILQRFKSLKVVSLVEADVYTIYVWLPQGTPISLSSVRYFYSYDYGNRPIEIKMTVEEAYREKQIYPRVAIQVRLISNLTASVDLEQFVSWSVVALQIKEWLDSLFVVPMEQDDTDIKEV